MIRMKTLPYLQSVWPDFTFEYKEGLCSCRSAEDQTNGTSVIGIEAVREMLA